MSVEAGLSLALLLGTVIGAQAGQTTPLAVGNWKGGAWADDATKEFRNCGLSLKFQAGTELTVIVGSNFSTAFIVADPRIQATPRQQFTTPTKFDQNPDQPTSALALSATMVQFSPPSFPNAYDTVRNARRFGFVLPGLNTMLDVTGINQAMPKLFECVLSERAKMALPPAQANETTNADKAEVFATSLVAAERAGIGPYLAVADKDRPSGFGHALSVIGHLGVAGPDGPSNVLVHSHFYPAIHGQTIERMKEPRRANTRIACNDPSFESGDLPPIPNKPASFGIFVSCRGAYEEIYVMARRNGGHIEIGLAGPPQKRKTMEAVGAKYRAAFATLP